MNKVMRIILISQSHFYAQLRNARQKHFFAYSALIMGTLNGSSNRLSNSRAQRQNFRGGWIFPYGQKPM